MGEVWTVLIPILLTDIVNPVLFASMVFASGSRQPITNSVMVLLGHTLAYISAGFILAIGLESISERLADPQQIDFFFGFAIGILLIWAAFKSLGSRQENKKENGADLKPVKAFGLGMIVNFAGIPFALPYFAAVDQILKADLMPADAALAVLGYNFLYMLPFLAVPVVLAFFGQNSKVLLERMNNFLNKISAFLIPLLLGLVGLALVVDAILYFSSGTGLF